jgi:sec-independent protein translocase protein TatA
MSTLLFLGGIGTGEIIMILSVFLLFFGAKKIPDLARGLGSGIREFKDAASNVASQITAP